MKRALLALACVVLSCEPELSRDSLLQGRRCGAAKLCVAGYSCNEGNVCVPSGTLQSSASSGGSTAGDRVDVSSGGTSPGAGGSAAGMDTDASSGSGGLGSAGSNPLPELDAGSAPPAPPDAALSPDGGCTPVALFRDRDNDGFGSEREGDQDFACPKPGWVTVGGDCFDAVPTQQDPAELVHPGQTAYFPTGYHLDPNQLSVVSFDYDCSSAEDFDPSNSFSEQLPDCSSLVLPCIGNGYLPTGRVGPGVNQACGQEQFVLCQPEEDLSCDGEVREIDDNAQLARCR